jgi:hypothetical protein
MVENSALAVASLQQAASSPFASDADVPPSAPRTSVAKDSTKTTIEADGLRYRSKAPGSPFAATSSFGAATMSCFLCGKHRPRAMLKSKKLLGKSQPVCSPSCKELEAQLASKG